MICNIYATNIYKNKNMYISIEIHFQVCIVASGRHREILYSQISGPRK